jgi:uncharacterized membrane protein YqaE (UPF0057 family)
MVKYGKSCKEDSECKSNICEMTYDKINNPKGRFCVNQSKKWGNECFLNSDCISNRCELTRDQYGVPSKKRCVVIDGLKKEAEKSLYASGLPEGMKLDANSQKIAKEKVILNPHQKALAFRGRGPVASFVCTVIEFCLKIWIMILKLLYQVWLMVFKAVWHLLFGFFDGVFGGLTKGKNTQCSNNFSFYFRYFITILFPPAGVFMAKGITGFLHIVVCAGLTMLMYFPGLVYAIIIMRGSRPEGEECKIRR